MNSHNEKNLKKLDDLLIRVKEAESKEFVSRINARVQDHTSPWYCQIGLLVACSRAGYLVEFKLADIHYPFNKHRVLFKPQQLYLKEK